LTTQAYTLRETPSYGIIDLGSPIYMYREHSCTTKEYPSYYIARHDWLGETDSL
jgi:hypothetical protein